MSAGTDPGPSAPDQAARGPLDAGPVGVVAPHMDDAALSCGQMLSAHPGSHVVTVFTSGPKSVRPLPEWDRLSGWFQPGDDVMGLRQVEDDAAMAAVGAHGHRLDFWDEQYRAGRPPYCWPGSGPGRWTRPRPSWPTPPSRRP